MKEKLKRPKTETLRTGYVDWMETAGSSVTGTILDDGSVLVSSSIEAGVPYGDNGDTIVIEKCKTYPTCGSCSEKFGCPILHKK